MAVDTIKGTSGQEVKPQRTSGHSAVIVTNSISTSSEPLVRNSVRITLSHAKAK